MSRPFVPEDGDTVNCPSSWQSTRSCQSSSSQTADIKYADQDTQSKCSSSAGVQTDSREEKSPPDVDMSKLAAWLSRITPKVIDELDKSRRSRVFDDYKLQETIDSSMKHLYTLNIDKDHPQSGFVTSAIDWSSTGGMIAVSRCAKEHPSWCEHSGFVHLYQISRQDSSEDLPQRSLDVASCVTAICTHPTDSFILACGTISGEVVVWNLQRDEPIIIGNITLHGEAVAHMEWLQNFDVTQTRPILVSASRDGSVIIWTMKTLSGTLKPSLCFSLQSEKENLDLGIVCAKFNPLKPNFFVAGLEGGSVGVCSTDSKRPCIRKRASMGQDLDCYDPLLNILSGHKGTVTGVQWVPGSKDLFLSSGTDSELRLYSVSEFNLIRIIHLPEPAGGLVVCPSHPSTAITWSSLGSIHMHNFLTAKRLPPLDLKNNSVPLSTICIRTSSSQVLALGNAEGSVSVWQIPHSKFESSSEV